MNRRAVSTSPYLGSLSNGYAHPSGTALHYDDVPCVNGSVSVLQEPMVSFGWLSLSWGVYFLSNEMGN